MSYQIETRLASHNGWFTPAEAKKYYGKYARNGITWHWWGDGAGASKHDTIVSYFISQAATGKKSVNFVTSDNKITQVVEPQNAAWASQIGNATTVSVELQPTLGDEGYKKAGWLKHWLVSNGKTGTTNYPHKFWYATQCPGTISLDRIEQEYQKWRTGAYDPAPPAPTPTPPKQADLEWVRWKEGAVQYVTNKAPTKLWDFNQTTWAGFGNGVRDFAQGEQVLIVGEVNNKTLGAKYLLTEYSFSRKITNGFNAADLSVYVPPTAPAPIPPADPEPQVPEPYKPEWEANLRDIDDTKLWFAQDTDLIDITTGKPIGTKAFKKDEEFVCSALTKVGNVEYRITDYSFKKGIFKGVPISSLTLTEPGQPDVQPVPNYPVDSTKVIEFLQGLVKLITDFIANLLSRK